MSNSFINYVLTEIVLWIKPDSHTVGIYFLPKKVINVLFHFKVKLLRELLYWYYEVTRNVSVCDNSLEMYFEIHFPLPRIFLNKSTSISLYFEWNFIIFAYCKCFTISNISPLPFTWCLPVNSLKLDHLKVAVFLNSDLKWQTKYLNYIKS